MSAPRPAPVWLFGQVRFDEAAQTLECDGRPVELERRPLELLRLLLAHAGEVVTKEELLDALWPDRAVTENSLTKCVARLRQALGETAQDAIRTVHGYGYQFVAPVRREPRPTPAPAAGSFGFRPGEALPHRPNWRLVERLGAGGFADVWLGEQAKTHEQRVFKFAHDGVQLTALKREITLSRLLLEQLGTRADLARVLDWNLEAPPYFIEREWSPAGALPDWAAARGGLAALALPLRLDLAAQIADALAAAHSVGVLHKDVKPANVLIRLDEAGGPHIRLTDFGSGGALDAGRLGQLGITPLGFTGDGAGDDSGLSTRLYAAPEVLTGGPASVQADIYSLGIMLYQLIVADFTRPFAPGWEAGIPDEMLREDVALAADGDPARRLGDAGQLALRLRTLDRRRAAREAERRRQAEAEAARQALQRARARRGPLAVLGATLLAGLVAVSWLYVRAERAGRAAQQSAATSQAVTAFLAHDLLSAANPFLSADPNVSVRDLLPAATANLDRRFPRGSPERAAIEEAIGNAYAGLGDPDHARPLLEAALETRARLLGPGAPETQQARLDLLAMYRLNEDHPAMKGLAEEILAAQKASGRADAATELQARYAIAYADCQIKDSAAACIDPLRALAEEARRRLGSHDELFLDAEGTAAFALGNEHRFAEAIPMAREALTLAEEVYGPASPVVAERRNRLAQVLSEAGQTDEAIELGLAARRDLLAATGRETEESVNVANTVGAAYWNAKRPADALPLFQLALDYRLRTRGEAFVGTRETMNNVAHALSRLGRIDEAIALEGRVVDIEKRLGGPDHVSAIWHVDDLAGFEDRAGHLDRAERLYREAVARARAVVRNEWYFGNFAYHLAGVLAREGKTEEARSLLDEAIATLEATLGPEDAHSRDARAALAALPPAGGK